MDPFRFHDNRVKGDAIAAFAVGVVVSYVFQCKLGFGCSFGGFLSPGSLFQMLIILAVGGFWYTWRKVV